MCGLKWNGSGTQLASGGNDNRLIIWDKESTKPQFQFRTHQAAVKAIDWNPHQAGVLASGGGTADRHIRFWNTMTGTSIGAHDTGSQVSFIPESAHYASMIVVRSFVLIVSVTVRLTKYRCAISRGPRQRTNWCRLMDILRTRCLCGSTPRCIKLHRSQDTRFVSSTWPYRPMVRQL